MADIGDLQQLAQDFLDACVESLDTIPVFDPGLEGAPDRSFISPGQSADDCCDQLAVYVSGITESPASPGVNQGSPNCYRRNLVSLVARITRCVPGMNGDKFPETSALEAAAAQLNADAWALWNHIFNLHCAGLLFYECGEVFWDGVRSINPSGGCGGFEFRVRVELDGYQESLAS